MESCFLRQDVKSTPPQASLPTGLSSAELSAAVTTDEESGASGQVSSRALVPPWPG